MIKVMIDEAVKKRIAATKKGVVRSMKWTGTVLATIPIASPYYIRARDVAVHEVSVKVEAVQVSVAHAFGFERPPAPVPERTWSFIADEQADLQRLNRCLVRAVIKVESENCTNMKSKAGARGCMQLMPRTAAHYGLKTDEDQMDNEQNIYAGTKHLRELIDQYGLFKALQVYNAGPERMGKTQENIEYPHKVLKEWATCSESGEVTVMASAKI